MTNDEMPECDDALVMRLWREAGLPEYFLGNGGTNHKLVQFAVLCVKTFNDHRAQPPIEGLAHSCEVIRRNIEQGVIDNKHILKIYEAAKRQLESEGE